VKLLDVPMYLVDTKVIDISNDMRMVGTHYRELAMCAHKRTICFRKAPFSFLKMEALYMIYTCLRGMCLIEVLQKSYKR